MTLLTLSIPLFYTDFACCFVVCVCYIVQAAQTESKKTTRMA